MKNYILFIGLIFGLSISGYSQSSSLNLEHSKWTNFKTSEGSSWKVSKNGATGVPKMLYGGLTKAYSGTPETMARQFLSEYYELFSMKEGLTDLEYVKTQTNRGVHHITFQQSYNGVPVYKGQYKVHILENGKVNMVNGAYYPEIDLSTVPVISEKEGMTIVTNNLHISTVENEEITSELIVYPVDETQFVLAYKIQIFMEKPVTSWTFFIDAITGEIIDKRNRLTSGLGFDKISDTNTTNNRSIAYNYTEEKNNDIQLTPPTPMSRALPLGNVFIALPSGGQTPKTLLRLDGIGHKLAGSYVEVFNVEYSPVCTEYLVTCAMNEQAVPSGSSGSYTYNFYTYGSDPVYAESEFDEVNLYYHVDRFRNDFIEAIDEGGSGLGKVNAYAHANLADNAIFQSGNPGRLYFGYNSSDEKSFSWEDKVIYHEYMQAIIHDINSQIGSDSDEAGAINEGISDYMAGSFVNRPKILNYSLISKQRDMSLPVEDSYSDYSASYKEPHVWGEFFSSILWDIEDEIGNETTVPNETDILVYDALYYLSASPDFEEFLIAMLTADASNYSGAYADVIIDKFDTKGIDISTTVSGHITSNTTWDGVIDITGTVYVDDTYTLTIDAGTIVRIADNQSLIVSPGGKLLVDGEELSPVVFERLDPINDWYAITLMSSAGNSIKWALFDGGYINLSIASKNNTIEHSTFRNATYRTMQGWHNQDGSGNAEATISYSLIENSPTVGVVAHYIDLDMSYTTIRNNTQAGLYVLSGTTYPFHHNLITGNGSTTRDGVEVLSSGTFYMHNASLGNGYNEISDNGDDQISGSGDIIIGYDDYGYKGYNHISGNYTGSKYLVDNNSGVTIDAEYIWWGEYPVDPAMLDGSLQYDMNMMNPDPTIGVPHGADGQSPAKISTNTTFNAQLAESYDNAESKLWESTTAQQVRDGLHKLYQLAGLSGDSTLSQRFNETVLLEAQKNSERFTSTPLKNTLQNVANILYTKSLVRDERYGVADTFLKQLDVTALTGYDMRDYLHLKMVTETYHGKYEEALATLESLYSFQEAEGVDVMEVKAEYSPIEEDILARLKENGGVDDRPENQDEQRTMTKEFSLQNYPNPFNPTTNINFTLPQKSVVSLIVYDVLGREVATLVNGNLPAGKQTIRFDASTLANGMYLYKLRVDNQEIVRKMTLIK